MKREPTIALRLVLNALRSFNAPQAVIDHFERMDDQPSVGKSDQLETLRFVLRDLATKEKGLLVRLQDLQRRLLGNAAFRHDPNGANNALKARLAELISLGELQQLTADEAQAQLQTSGVVFMVVDAE